MIRLTLLLGGSIWVAMAVAPELDGPVFAEQVAEVVPVEETKPEVTRTAMADPVKVAAVVAAPEPVSALPAPVITPVDFASLPVVAAEPAHPVWYVTASRVNVREGPSTDYSVMGKVVYGEAALIVSDPNSDWVKIRIEGDGVEGFIMKRFMTKVDPLG